MATSDDNARPLLYSILVHLIGIGLVTTSLWLTSTTVQPRVSGQIIEATLIGAPAQAPTRRKPVPKPKAEPPKAEPKVEAPKEAPQEPQRPDTVDRDRVAEMAIAKADAEKKAQEERKRQEKILLDEKKAKEEEAKKLADEKKKNLEKERLAQLKDQEKKDAKLEKARLAELMEAEEAKTGQEGKDNSLLGQYAAAIQVVVLNAWHRPASAQAGLHCTLHIVQIPGGDVISAKVTSPCNADELVQTSIEQAVLAAAPLPYKGFEPVFKRDIDFNFSYDGQ